MKDIKNKDIVLIIYIFLWLIISCACIYFNLNIVIAQFILCLILLILVLLRKNHKIEKWYNTQYNKYYLLEDNEREIWQNIIAKANKGYNEWYNETHGNDLCGPWIVDIKPEEIALLDKIHEMFYGKDWYVVMSLPESQCCYVEYEDIKNKVKFN